MFQNKPHWLRFLVYGTDNVGFFAVVPIANFRGTGDDEKMNLSNLDGKTARNKPLQLCSHLEGLVSILQQPIPELLRRAANTSPIVKDRLTQETETLLGQLAAATQPPTQPPTPTSQASKSRASTPESQGSKAHMQTGGKAPRAENQQRYLDKQVHVSSESDSTSGTSSEDEIPCAQPSKAKPAPKAKTPTMVQTTLGSKKQKLQHLATVDDENQTSIHFSGSNMITAAQLNSIVEERFLKHVADKEAEKPKRGRKPGPQKKDKVVPMFDKAGKASSAASTEQKGTPLFMNGQLISSV